MNGSLKPQATQRAAWIDWLKKVSWTTLALVVLAVLMFGYYYRKTSATTVLIIPGSFPQGLSPGFTTDELSSSLLSSLERLRRTAQSAGRSSQTSPANVELALGRLPAASATDPEYTTLRNPLPIFDTKVRGVSLGMLREWAVQAKVRQFILIDATAGRSGGSGFLLHAMLQDKSRFEIKKDWWVPRHGSCRSPLDICTNELAEDILAHEQPNRCLGYDEIGYSYLLKYQINRQIEDLSSAEDLYRKAIMCADRDPVAYCNLGNVLIRKWNAGGRVEAQLANDAVDYSKKALALNPQLAEAAVNLGYLEYVRGQHRQALDYFDKIGREFPTNQAVLLNSGFLLYREYLNGRSDLLAGAVQKTRSAWDLGPSFIAANNLGFFLYEMDNVPDSVKYWQEARRLNPDDPDVLGGLALGLYKSGQQKEAIALYREVINRDAKMKDPQNLRDSHFWSKKAVEDALPLIQAASSG